MSKGSRIVWWIIALLVIVGVIYYLSNLNEDTGGTATKLTEPLKIGGIVPLTGDGAAYGIPIQRAAQMAVSEINAAGGVGGQPMDILWEDGKCEGKEATLAAQKLVNVNRVPFIIGGACSSESLAMLPITEPAQVIIISPSSTSPDLSKVDSFFRFAPSDANAGRIAAEYARTKLGFEKAAIISEQKDYTQGLHKVFKETFTTLGGTIVAEESYQTGATDFRTQITKIKAANPEVVYLLPQTPAPGVVMLKQLKESGIKAQLLTAEVLIGRDAVKDNATTMEGLVGIEQYFDEKAERAQAFLKKYKETYNEDAPFPAYMAGAHASLFAIKETVEANGLDAVKNRAWLSQLKDWPATPGNVTFDTFGDLVSSYIIHRVSEGKLTDLDIVK
ncbi:MAG: ABC transporter substrate-binding protein [bacterium]|nr:ABC transporter substrate-binding protein [bacterium]